MMALMVAMVAPAVHSSFARLRVRAGEQPWGGRRTVRTATTHHGHHSTLQRQAGAVAVAVAVLPCWGPWVARTPAYGRCCCELVLIV